MRYAMIWVIVLVSVFGCHKSAETPPPVADKAVASLPVGEKSAPREVAIRPPPPNPEEIARAARQQAELAAEKAAAEKAAREAEAARQKATEDRRLLEEEALAEKQVEERWGALSIGDFNRARNAVQLLMACSDNVTLMPDEVGWCLRSGLLRIECRTRLQSIGFYRQRKTGLHDAINKGLDPQRQLRIAELWGAMNVNAAAVYCTPWSVLKISGLPRPNASSNASRQNRPSSVFDKRHERT
jgi:hypothetical protein